MLYKRALFLGLIGFLLFPIAVRSQSDFNPDFIISDAETQDCSWTRTDIQQFLNTRGSYLRSYTCPDANGTTKSAADIIYDAATTYQINPKFLLVTLQKEQSLITDNSPDSRQLDWATGYGVCDSCSTADGSIDKYRGFGRQVDNTAGLIRWYYNNKDKSYIKKKDTTTLIDGLGVTPQSWATGFLYTYTPHLHGNRNFWRIWQTWFGQNYPDGTVLQSSSSSEYYLIQNGQRRKFKTKAALISRLDPNLAIKISDTDLANYELGPEISFPNYSVLKTSSTLYLLDYDTLRPFVSPGAATKLGYNLDEAIEVSAADLTGYTYGNTITATSTAPSGIIYYIPELKDPYFFIRDGVARQIADRRVVDVNYKKLKVEKHTLKELRKFSLENDSINFRDGALIKSAEFNRVYVMEKGKARPIADNDTFIALGYKHENITTVPLSTLIAIPVGETIFLNTSLLSTTDRYLGDSEAKVSDLYGSKLPAYLVAEYPSGKIISGKNIDGSRSIASLTKIMTAFEALSGSFDRSKSSTYSEKKHASEGNILKLKNNQKVNNGDMLDAMLVISTNNAARVVAQNSGFESEAEFVRAMNNRLADWGADNTTLIDPAGLDAGNVSTARDLLKIFVKSLKNDIIKKDLGSVNVTLKSIKNGSKSRVITNTNLLYQNKKLSYEILASKTGYLDECGANLIMLIKDKKSDQQFVIVTLGDSDYKNRFVEPDKISKWIISKN